jgi:hypothetical protein
MKESITISLEEYNVLRGTFKKAIDFLDNLGKVGGQASERKTPKPKPKETKQQGMDRYERLIDSGLRAKKPEHLKK